MDPQRQSVFLKRCSEYDPESVASCIDEVAKQSGHLSQLHGAEVLLKPNLISSRGLALSCSHPQFIAGAALWFKEQGARVRVGDSPAFGTALSVCRSKGIDGHLKRLGVEIVNFSTPVEKELSCGRTISIAAESLEADLFVGLPRIKAHNQMYVTLAVKNLFGIVKGVNKALLHMTCENSYDNFSKIILGLVELLPNQFHLIDGIEVMSESGPLNGKPLQVGCIGASQSPIALDTAILDLLEVDVKRSPLYMMAKELRLTGSHLSAIDFPFEKTSAFYDSGFIPPETLNPIRFNPFRFFSGMLRRFGLKLSS